MFEVQKGDFTRATRELANNYRDNARGNIDVDSVEKLATDLIQGLISAHTKHSTQYTVKIKDRVNLWFVKELWEMTLPKDRRGRIRKRSSLTYAKKPERI